MRTKSWMAILLAVLLAVIACVGLIRPFRDEPPFDERAARRLISEGTASLRRHDTSGILSVMAPEARVLGRPLRDLAAILAHTNQEVEGSLDARASDIVARQHGNEADLSFDLEIGQHTQAMDAVYFPHLHFRVKLERRRADRLLGLISASEWKVTRIDSDPPMDLPTL